MKVSYNWLSEYVKIPYNEVELIDRLTMAGIEVEAVAKTSIPSGVIIAEILERNAHPDASKLSICRVFTGKEELQIVCGAPNCNAGIKAPLAQIGTEFDDPSSGEKYHVGKCKLRGVESFGMLCGAEELGLNKEHEGILELPDDAPVGIPLGDYIKPDLVFDLEITPNRPDLLSHIGIAREIAALSRQAQPGLPLPGINLSGNMSGTEDYANLVEVQDPDLCPRYTARIIKNVKVDSSPAWLQERLNSIGLRPVNNIVDITNFVLFETGQPLHAFDFDRLADRRIIVRRAKRDEKITTLDKKEYKLNSSHLMICDTECPVALGGVMGGENSGITEKTVNILLESAYFKPANIRATSRELAVSSDSSYRFERGVDFEMVSKASDRAASLILELAGGELASNLIDVCSQEQKPRQALITCRFEKVAKLLGINIMGAEIIDIFNRLGFSVRNADGNKCEVIPPSFRPDLEREADLIEEVARIHGLSEIRQVPVMSVSGGSMTEDSYTEIAEAREQLLSLGLNECMNYSIVDEKSAMLDSVVNSKNDLIVLSNPINQEFCYMRPSLLAGMVRTLEYNIARKNSDLALFEIGRTYFSDSERYPEERNECCLALTGRKHPERYSCERKELYDFYDLKGLIEAWMEYRRIENLRFRKVQNATFANGMCAEIVINGKPMGILGQISTMLTESMRAQNPVYMALIQLDRLFSVAGQRTIYQPVSPYPAVTRDVALIADNSLENQMIIDLIMSSKVKNLEKVELFDVFHDDESLGKGKKSLAYTVTFRNPERTLTDKEVNEANEKIRKKLVSEFSVELR